MTSHPMIPDTALEAIRDGVGIRAERAPEWQPISTAPSDGRMALAYRPLARNSHDEPVALKRFIGGFNHCWACTVPYGEMPTNPTDGACHVTHWMPLPEPPQDILPELADATNKKEPTL